MPIIPILDDSMHALDMPSQCTKPLVDAMAEEPKKSVEKITIHSMELPQRDEQRLQESQNQINQPVQHSNQEFQKWEKQNGMKTEFQP